MLTVKPITVTYVSEIHNGPNRSGRPPPILRKPIFQNKNTPKNLFRNISLVISKVSLFYLCINIRLILWVEAAADRGDEVGDGGMPTVFIGYIGVVIPRGCSHVGCPVRLH